MYKSSKLLTILFATLFMGIFSSCSDDDESQYNLLIGEWEEIDNDSNQNPSHVWTFNSDGSFIWGYNNGYEDEEGNWKLQNGVIVLFDDDEYYKIVKLDKTYLIVQDIEEGHEGRTLTFIRVQEDSDED